ncbi:MAG TPA: hypothetical protein VF474_02760, partial [Phenylobacterium sp.]
MVSADLGTIRELVLDSAKFFDDEVVIDDADVVEQSDDAGTPALLIRLRADPRQTRNIWSEVRLRISHRVRDELLRVGDNR